MIWAERHLAAQEGRPRPEVDELVFRASAATSLGIELELPVLDSESAELVPGAPRILDACEEEKIPGVGAELMQSMVEVRTGICADTREARQQILTRLRRVRNLAASLGYDLALMGTHPFLRPSTSAVTDRQRFQKVRVRLAWMTYHRVAFGLHVHVGVASGDQAIGVINLLTPYLPHLLAISANSPFWQGVDTGLVSCRAPLYGLVPHSGVPGTFQKWKEFRGYFETMRDARAFKSVRDLKWDIRPRSDLGTLEFRICDMPMSLRQVFALASLTRTLVLWAQQLLHDKPRSGRGDRRRQWLTTQNKWLAARYGLEALYIRTPAGKRQPLRNDLNQLLERVRSVAEEAGEWSFLQTLRPVESIEMGASRQRKVYRETGAWRALIAEMKDRLAHELQVTGDGRLRRV
jgi:glutamate---cysteine ligase / carboxylate-amine ligase